MISNIIYYMLQDTYIFLKNRIIKGIIDYWLLFKLNNYFYEFFN